MNFSGVTRRSGKERGGKDPGRSVPAIVKF